MSSFIYFYMRRGLTILQLFAICHKMSGFDEPNLTLIPSNIDQLLSLSIEYGLLKADMPHK